MTTMTTETAIQIQVSRHQQTLVDISRHQQTLVDTSRHQQTDSDLDSIRNSYDVLNLSDPIHKVTELWADQGRSSIAGIHMQPGTLVVMFSIVIVTVIMIVLFKTPAPGISVQFHRVGQRHSSPWCPTLSIQRKDKDLRRRIRLYHQELSIGWVEYPITVPVPIQL